MYEELFLKRRLIPSKLRAYGFEHLDGEYRLTCTLDDYILHVTLDRHGNPDTALLDMETLEEYALYKTAAEGSYVGYVREMVREKMQEIVDRCSESAVFRQPQTERLLTHAAEVYGNEPEFLWKETPQNGILRRADSGKWYAALLTVPQSKLGLASQAPVEIVNLHANPEAVAGVLSRPEIYPAWHMNKKSWFTVILDGSISDEELFAHLSESYRLAALPAGKHLCAERSPRKGGKT